MAEIELRFPDFAAESACTRSGNVISLTGTAVTNHRTFADAEADTAIRFDDGEVCAVDIIDGSGGKATWSATYDTTGNGTLTWIKTEAGTAVASLDTTGLTVYASVPGSAFSVRESGTAFPVAADYPGGSIPDGARFYHQTRKVLYGYEQGWVAREAHDDVTVYVDGDSGTDGDDYGYGTGANAFATIAGMLARIPKSLLGNTLTISLAAKTGNYSEGDLAWTLPVDGKIVITGTSEVTEGTATAINTIDDDHWVTNNDAREYGCRFDVSGTPSGWASGKRFYRVTSGSYQNEYGALMESGTSYLKATARTENRRAKATTTLPLEVELGTGDLTTESITPVTLGVVIDGAQVFSGRNINVQFIKFLARVTVDVDSPTHFFVCEFDSTPDALLFPIKLLSDCYMGACYCVYDATNTGFGLLYVEAGLGCVFIASYFESEDAGPVIYTNTPYAFTSYACRYKRTATTGAAHTVAILNNATAIFGSNTDLGNTVVNLSTNSSAYGIGASLAGIVIKGQNAATAVYGAGNSGTNDHDPTTSTGFALVGT